MQKNNRAAGILLLLGLTALEASAQDFRVQAPLEPVPSPGFYRIPLQPALTAYARADLSDVRISEGGKTQVPYLLRRSTAAPAGTALTPFPVLRNSLTDSGQTVLELAVQGVEGTDRLALLIANTAAARYTALSGSHDRRRWYTIDDHILLRPAGDDRNGSVVQSIFFPFSRYPYLRLRMENGRADPLNILQAGVYRDTAAQPPSLYVANPAPTFRQTDSSDGFSYITIRSPEPYLVDRLELQLGGPPFYSRPAMLFDSVSGPGGRRSALLLTSFDLTSGRPAAVDLGSLKTTALLLKVDNGDNPPLKVTRVQTGQLQRSLVAYLQPGKTYYLQAGNEKAAAPRYDLAQFADSIPPSLHSLTYGPLTVNGKDRPEAQRQAEGRWLWPAVLLMVGVLGFLTYRLTGEVAGRK
ncbi:hypothetical protein V9K67_08175 [Paraflavisolibacter sp. H34]|uniref:hypothetical protein n=1 Tax=Huijunlia imazamoxiresistens TaxID=3127457 RepID=UPI0030199D34